MGLFSFHIKLCKDEMPSDFFLKTFQQGQLCHPSPNLLNDTSQAIYMSTSFSATESSNEDMTSTRSLSVTLLCTEKRCYSIPPHHYFIQIHSVPFTETMLSFVSRKKRVNLSLHRVFESY